MIEDLDHMIHAVVTHIADNMTDDQLRAECARLGVYVDESTRRSRLLMIVSTYEPLDMGEYR